MLRSSASRRPPPLRPLLLLLLLALAARAGPPQFSVQCAAAGFPVPGSTACSLCGVSSLRASAASVANGQSLTTTCFESFEQNAIGAGGFMYAPQWNEWGFAPNTGVSGSNGPWAPQPAAAAVGDYFVFIQAPAVNTTYADCLTRRVYNLYPFAPATVSFAVAYRAGYGPVTGALAVTFDGAPVGTYTGIAGLAWTFVSYTFTPTKSSGVLAFSYTMTGPVAGDSISIDALSVDVVCPLNTYSSQASGSCVPCSGATLAGGGCTESFEGAAATGVAAGGFKYGPAYNDWRFGGAGCTGTACCAGVSAIGSPWDTVPAGTASGGYYAFVQNTCALSRSVTGLAGSWAILEFFYTFRYKSDTGNALDNPIVVTWNGKTIFETVDWLSAWTPVSVAFPISSADGVLAIGQIDVEAGDYSILVDAISLNSFCAPGSAPNPTVAAGCKLCAAGTFLESPMTAAGPVTACRACPAGTFA